MARKIVHQLIDDIDGTEIEIGDGETVTFSIDGTAYEIDLSTENAAALRAAFEPYVSAARSISSARTGATTARRRVASSASSAGRTPLIREWAKSEGLEVSERGRIPASVIEAYDAAH